MLAINGTRSTMMAFFIKGDMRGKVFTYPLREMVITFYGTYNTDLEEHQLPVISRQLAKSGCRKNRVLFTLFALYLLHHKFRIDRK